MQGSKRLLIFGLTGQIGQALQALLAQTDWQVVAYTRSLSTAACAKKNAGNSQIQWRPGSLESLLIHSDYALAAEQFAAVLSLGPIDAFADAFQHAAFRAKKIVAFSSTSVHSKSQSSIAKDRVLADTLRRCERIVQETAVSQNADCIILRPTLIWGHGGDHSLTPLLRLARRFKFMVLPRNAAGLRQPVHVDDLAKAAMAALACDGVHTFDLPGGETLSLREMLSRSLRIGAPRTWIVYLPNFWFRVLGRLIGPLMHRNLAGFIDRLQQDQVYSAKPAAELLDYRPAKFEPNNRSFG